MPAAVFTPALSCVLSLSQAALAAAADGALSEWLADAQKAIEMLVTMEQQFISADFFRARAFATAGGADGCVRCARARAAAATTRVAI
jgi:hypothetical protein